KPEGVYAPWDAIRFTVSPVGEALVDVDGARLGVQISIYIDVSRSGLVEGDFNGYMKYVSQDALNGGGLTDLDGNPITQAGWYDFTQRKDSAGNYVGDGARFVISGGKIVGIVLTVTDNAFGDNNPLANRILDPGLPVLVDATPPPLPAPILDAPQSPSTPWYEPMAYEWNWYDIEYPDIKISYVITGEYATPEYFTAPSLTNTALKGAWPLETASPYSPEQWLERNAILGAGIETFKDKEIGQRDLPLRNVLKPSDVLLAEGTAFEYLLPRGTFVGGQGPINLMATLKDGSPLPAWMRFDSATGKLTAEVPSGLRQALEIRIEASDSKGQRAETTIKLKPNDKQASFEGKRSFSSQMEAVLLMRA
ncbi:putative Ig domain-containing protein, partial [Zwartia sp.]|uniref:putative Ig domain-containing protein n=1 Tax=Zwartia sp. TaxID=2978004 RepID=UPI00271807E4